MAGSVNKCIILGNLGKDPDIRRTQDGRAICNLSIATSDSWRDKTTGERKERTEWHRVVIFNENLAKIAGDYLKKGSKVYIEGQLQTRKWTNQQGQDQYSTEIVLQNFNHTLTLLDGRSEGQQSGSSGGGGQQGGYSQSASKNMQAPIGQGAAGGGHPPQGAGFGGGTAGGGGHFDKDLDDEIPFVFKEIATPWDTV